VGFLTLALFKFALSLSILAPFVLFTSSTSGFLPHPCVVLCSASTSLCHPTPLVRAAVLLNAP
jgi:hypothetical protein